MGIHRVCSSPCLDVNPFSLRLFMRMLICVAAAVVACRAPIGGSTSKFAGAAKTDPDYSWLEEIGGLPARRLHQRPSWVDGIAGLPPQEVVSRFYKLSVRDQLEFAVFMYMDQRPPDLSWSMKLAKANREASAVILGQLPGEVDEDYVLALLRELVLVSETTKEAIGNIAAAEERVARIVDPTVKFYATETLTEIRKLTRR